MFGDRQSCPRDFRPREQELSSCWGGRPWRGKSRKVSTSNVLEGLPFRGRIRAPVWNKVAVPRVNRQTRETTPSVQTLIHNTATSYRDRHTTRKINRTVLPRSDKMVLFSVQEPAWKKYYNVEQWTILRINLTFFWKNGDSNKLRFTPMFIVKLSYCLESGLRLKYVRKNGKNAVKVYPSAGVLDLDTFAVWWTLAHSYRPFSCSLVGGLRSKFAPRS